VNAYPRPVAVLFFVLIAVAGLSLSGPAGAATGSGTGVVDCAGAIVERPREIVVTCADAGVVIQRITWTAWTASRARGSGTLTWNTCLPKTCVNGIVQKYKVAVTLGRVASGPNAPVFTRVGLGFAKGGPAGLESGAYTIDRPISTTN
jgi:hypothetical protein